MKTNYKILCICLVLFVVAGFFWFLRPVYPSVFKVGVLAPLSGNFAVLGERVKNGFELAKEDLFKREGLSVEVIMEDACQPKEVITAVTKLIKENKIDILGGSFCVAGFVPVIPVLEQNDIIGVNLAPNPDSVLGHNLVVSTNSSIKLKATELGRFASDELKANTSAIIYYNTPLGEDYRKYFKQEFEANGGKVISSEMTLVDSSDFRAELTKIKANNPDIIFVVQLAKPLANLLRQSHELGMQSKILGNSQNEDQSIINVAGDSAEGFIISSDEPLPKTATVLDFDTRYKEKYKQDADVFARNAYDALMLEVASYNKCKKDNSCILNYFHSLKKYDGVSGSITIESDGTASKPTSFKIVKEGKFVPFVNGQ